VPGPRTGTDQLPRITQSSLGSSVGDLQPIGTIAQPGVKGFGARIDHTHIGPSTLGYASVNVNQAGIVAEVDLANLSVTVVAGGSRRLRITASFDIQSTVAGDQARCWIKEGATYLQSCDTDLRVANQRYRVLFQAIVTAIGSHTYRLAASRNGGTGSLTMTANGISSGIDPAFLLVEDIGGV